MDTPDFKNAHSPDFVPAAQTPSAAMDNVGIDLGRKESQIAIISEAGELIEKRIRTERERLIQYFKDRPKAKILMEASTISEWVARLLEELGHEVIVADPNYAPMYAQRTRWVKTDKRDARALAEACKLGAYRPAHRTSDEQRHVRALLGVRERLVRSRASFVTLVQAIREGISISSAALRQALIRLHRAQMCAWCGRAEGSMMTDRDSSARSGGLACFWHAALAPLLCT